MIKDYSGIIIKEYEEFVQLINEIGFMPLSNNCIDFISLSAITHAESWHTDHPDDPWLWKTRVETEHKAAYAKIFDKKPGFISLDWYPVFLAARRNNKGFDELYSDGLMSNYAKQIYSLFEHKYELAAHEIKALIGYGKESASKYEAALIELQMKMLVTGNGLKYKLSKSGEEYGWPVISYTTTERWIGQELMEKARNIDPAYAMETITKRIDEICPGADKRRIKKFIDFEK